MIKASKLIIDPKKWLGDNKILKMDWDVRAMHFHLILIAWQNTPQGYIEAKDIGKYLSLDLNGNDWLNRISVQLKDVWQKKKMVNEYGIEIEYYYQSGLIKEIEKQINPKKVVKKVIEKEIVSSKEVGNVEDIGKGFLLLDIISDKNDLSEEEKKEINNLIWNVGVNLLTNEKSTHVKASAMISKLLKEYGSEKLSNGIKELSNKNILPMDNLPYLISLLKNGIFKKDENKKGFTKTYHNQANGRLIL